MPTHNEPKITIEFEDDLNVLVSYPYYEVSHRVNLGPDPTWPSAKEANDMVTEAVRIVLDAAYYAASGSVIER